MKQIEKILAEIQRLKKDLDGYTAEEGLDYIESYINLISREPPSMPSDMEDAAETFARFYYQKTCDGIVQDCFIAGAKWQEKRDEETIKTAEDHAFLAGAEWQKKKDDEEQAELFTIVALDAAQRAKEQMMKGAVEGEIVDSGFDDGTAILKAIVPDRKYDSGDKVKLIVIKED